MTSVALTIAGSDPSGGAGIQADLKTFHQHDVYGCSVLTLLTAQNTIGVQAVHTLDPSLIIAQLDAVVADIPPVAAKTGAMGNAAIIEAVGEHATRYGFPLIVDPVMISKHGDALIEPDATRAIRQYLMPRAFLITPNMAEASTLAERDVTTVEDMGKAAATLGLLGVPHVLVKGGRLSSGEAIDVLWSDGELHRFSSPRIDTPHTHGSGCVYSAAITARLARGEELVHAVQGAKSFVSDAIRSAPQLGSGHGPLNLRGAVPPIES